MIKPQPTTYTCTNCGWSKTVSPNSDALLPGEVVSACPKCGNEELQAKKASLIAKLMATVKNINQP
ncbi:MAG: hypothetical protein EOM68_06165 [Spirochaetia bacterium]|nr:hypothetical protein [Spirochaetia bacterium]